MLAHVGAPVFLAASAPLEALAVLAHVGAPVFLDWVRMTVSETRRPRR